MPDRRTFLITCGTMVAAPAFAHFGLPLAGSSLPAAVAPAAPKLVLGIDGWESSVDIESVVWVHVNSFWRANWR